MRRALLVSLLGVAALTGCAQGHASRSAGAVPWANRPLSLYHTPQPKPIRYPTTAPLCAARQLRVTQGRDGAATGHVLEEFVFTNVGPRACLLRGYPAISVETPTGRRRQLSPHHGTFFVPLVPANLAPGRHVFLEVETDDLCVGGEKPVIRYRNLAFGLPWGGVVDGGNVSLSEQCGLAVSEFGLQERYAPTRARPGTPGTLLADVQLPAGLRAGATRVDYVVTLRNPRGTPVRLTPCPGYTEGVYVPNMVVHRSFALDCDSVHVIPAHGRVRFAMRLTLPRPLPADRTLVKFSWSLDTPTGPFVGRALVVRGA